MDAQPRDDQETCTERAAESAERVDGEQAQLNLDARLSSIKGASSLNEDHPTLKALPTDIWDIPGYLYYTIVTAISADKYASVFRFGILDIIFLPWTLLYIIAYWTHRAFFWPMTIVIILYDVLNLDLGFPFSTLFYIWFYLDHDWFFLLRPFDEIVIFVDMILLLIIGDTSFI